MGEPSKGKSLPIVLIGALGACATSLGVYFEYKISKTQQTGAVSSVWTQDQIMSLTQRITRCETMIEIMDQDHSETPEPATAAMIMPEPDPAVPPTLLAPEILFPPPLPTHTPSTDAGVQPETKRKVQQTKVRAAQTSRPPAKISLPPRPKASDPRVQRMLKEVYQ